MNGVDSSRFHSATQRAPIPGCPFTDPDLWLVGTVGRLDAVKDQGNLASAFVAAVHRNPEAKRRMRLLVVGEGRLRADIETILRQGGVRHLAWLAGERHDIPVVLQGLDCFVLPSLAEGVSNTVLEAMASGLPVVATRVGANSGSRRRRRFRAPCSGGRQRDARPIHPGALRRSAHGVRISAAPVASAWSSYSVSTG